MDFRVIIPARYASSRLPGKPLEMIGDKPMLQHVYERSVASGAMSVVIATDDERIREAAEAFGAQVCMTQSDHRTGTERLAEAVVALGYDKDEVVVNVQGDEPLISPELITRVAQDLMAHANTKVATLCERIEDIEDIFDPNVVKVTVNERGFAMLFSRAPIPWEFEGFAKEPKEHSGKHLRHIGIYGYRVSFLDDYFSWEKGPYGEIENLEQLRVLWHACRIHVSEVTGTTERIGVDTPEDLARVRKLIKKAKK